MLADIGEVKKRCSISDEEVNLLESTAAPIVLVELKNDIDIAQGVAPGLHYLGVMMPYTPLHYLLMTETRLPLVMTSGNLSEEPIACDNDEALIRLKGIADYFLVHNRDIYSRYDDSVYIIEDKQPIAVRRARGYAPYPVMLPHNSEQILACGAELKNTFCLTRDNHAFVSQHIGDMENEETLQHFEDTIEIYRRLFRIKPELIACDAHPEYLPSKFALSLSEKENLRLVQVQHHHAHIVSCMTENNINGPVIGVAFDGVGYGTDGAVWGGEFLVADNKTFKRAGQLEYVPMPGGALAIKKPYRMALGYIYSLLDTDFDINGLPLSVKPGEIDIIRKQVKQGLNSPLTSSMGRLFDAVSAIAGVREEASYEAQAAIELEMLAPAGKTPVDCYPYRIDDINNVKTVLLGELISTVIRDVKNKIPASIVSHKLHGTVAEMTLTMCRKISEETRLKQVALSGGVFQNRLLLRLTRNILEEAGFRVFIHHLVPTNDGGISLGQAVIAHYAE
ncbi:MAG TPA: carbamoyltransferase HypF, partial [Dehalococcoidales bacterium]|nr:carbamoyltransferase HypF [Dehalococcoidales bacterium]